MQLHKTDFGSGFAWGVSASAPQTEGAWNEDGRGLSSWDVFAGKKNGIAGGDTPYAASDFYHRFEEDISIIARLHIPNFRFSLAWPRIIPTGTGNVNQKGIGFYNRVIDACLRKNITPWITLYHWDLPHLLEQKGGWENRDIVGWFREYVAVCIHAFGDRVRHWMVLNEPMVFTGSGYYLGHHAPGKKGLDHFLPAVHHAALCQAAGARMIKRMLPRAEAGSTFSCTHITPATAGDRDMAAAKRVDALLNRLFIEPALGLGYPLQDLPFMRRIEKYFADGDDERLKAPLDFAGIQNYTREVVKHRIWTPYLHAGIVPAHKRKVHHTGMNWEVYPPSIYEVIKKFSAYHGLKKLIITENGAAFEDAVENGSVHDTARVRFFNSYLAEVLRAKQEGMKADGYFIWSLTDNFEWAEGYRRRFGLVHVDFSTQQRTIKDSGYWYRSLLRDD